MDKTLFREFKKQAKANGLTVSKVLRELIQEYMLEQLRLAHVNGEAMAEEV
jgi:DNA-binding transcriptional regulator YhcF (GntR family)